MAHETREARRTALVAESVFCKGKYGRLFQQADVRCAIACSQRAGGSLEGLMARYALNLPVQLKQDAEQ
jgi:hypothetical protein